MKRNYQQHKQEGGGATPSGRFLQPKPAVQKSQGAKRSRQTTLRAFLSIETPHAATATPSGAGPSVPAAWPSTAQRAFENFKLDTPRLPSKQEHAKPGKQPSTKLAGQGNKECGEEEEFRMYSSQTYNYVRRSSQADAEQQEEDEEPATTHWDVPSSWGAGTQAAGVTQPVQPVTQAHSDLVTQDLCGLTQDGEHTADSLDSSSHPHGTTPLPAQQAISTDSHQVDLRAGGSHAAAVTPELVPVHQTGVTDKPGSVGEKQAMFDARKPVGGRKQLIVVRHGESEYNHACVESKTCEDPLIFDPKLTAKGMQQCKDLRKELGKLLREKANDFGEPLFVISPLTRTIQTFLESCPWPERLPPAANEAGGSGASSASTTTQAPLNIEVLPLISEHLVTSGDVGRPPHALAQDFPQIAEHLSKLQEHWWFQSEGKPNCAMSRTWGSAESKDHMLHRVTEFERWLRNRKEQLIVLVGHSSFWRAFTKQERMGNCGVLEMQW